MSGQLKLEVLTPEKEAVKQEVDAVYLQSALGRLGILPQHTALISTLEFGTMEIITGGQTEEILCGSGLVEVTEDRVTVLVRSAERKDEIDVERAKEAQKRAKQQRDSKEDFDLEIVKEELNRADKRLEFAGHN